MKRELAHLQWLPPQVGAWRARPTDVAGRVVGHEDGGSLLACLRRRGRASAPRTRARAGRLGLVALRRPLRAARERDGGWQARALVAALWPA